MRFFPWMALVFFPACGPSTSSVDTSAVTGGSTDPNSADSSVALDATTDARFAATEASDGALDGGPYADGCTGRPFHCGPCDFGQWSTCIAGQWTCESGFSQVGCECYRPQTMGLSTCCPSDAGATLAQCSVPESGYGHYGSGTLTCANGATPYVKDAGPGSCP